MLKTIIGKLEKKRKKKKKKDNDMNIDVAQLEYSNSKCYVSAFRNIQIGVTSKCWPIFLGRGTIWPSLVESSRNLLVPRTYYAEICKLLYQFHLQIAFVIMLLLSIYSHICTCLLCFMKVINFRLFFSYLLQL